MDSSSGNGIFTQADLGCTISRKTELVDAHHAPAKTALTYRGVERFSSPKEPVKQNERGM